MSVEEHPRFSLKANVEEQAFQPQADVEEHFKNYLDWRPTQRKCCDRQLLTPLFKPTSGRLNFHGIFAVDPLRQQSRREKSHIDSHWQTVCCQNSVRNILVRILSALADAFPAPFPFSICKVLVIAVVSAVSLPLAFLTSFDHTHLACAVLLMVLIETTFQVLPSAVLTD